MAMIDSAWDDPVARPAPGDPGTPLHPVAVNASSGGANIAVVEMTGMSAADHIHCYRRALMDLFEVRLLTGTPQAVVRGVFFGTIHITYGAHSARALRRTLRLAARDGNDAIVLQLTQGGRWQGRVQGRSLSGGPGTSALFDLAQSFTVSDLGDRSFVGALIPRALARQILDDPAEFHGRIVEGAEGAALAGLLTGLVNHAPASCPQHGAMLADMLIDLIGLAFRTPSDRRFDERRGPDRRLRDRIERLIALRLNARDLTPEWIADKLGISRSQLYAAAPAGGIVRMIWERRLAAAHGALTDPLEDRTIATLAGQFGFASNAHFSRAYTKRFGATPSAVRKATLERIADAPVADV